jgi:ParB-like chromosome segregation protein Spo0J
MDQRIEMLPVAELTAYAKNSRTHSPAQVKQIEASIREFGFTNPILVDGSGGIIAGHGRVTAAKSMGLETVPCLRLSHLTEAQKRAYIIADNRLAENAGWDNDMLRLELGDLAGMDFDLGLLGFGSDELDGLLKELDLTGGQTDENDVPPVPEEPTTKPGDLWQLGKHRIICGSSTDALTIGRLLAGAKPHLMVTDPPYGVEYDASWRDKAKLNHAGGQQRERC